MMLRNALFLLLGFLPLASAIFGLRTASSSHHGRLANLPDFSKRLQHPLHVRGGSTRIFDNSDDEDDDDEEEVEIDPEEEKRRLALQKWRMDQQLLMQVRGIFLSEALAKRGIPLVTITDVSTADGDKPPEKVDWDCAMSTNDEPKSCLYSFDAEPNTKVVAPIDTNQWITLSALNRLRRTDPTKVEPMWHNQYAVLSSWFGDDSEYSILSHVGAKGLLISLLLDTARAFLLKSVLVAGILSVAIIFMPMLEFLVNRILTSGLFWKRWPTWGRIVHAALPLKLLLGQLAWKFLASSFGKLENRVRDAIVDMECTMLEESIPLTVGPGSQVEEEDIEMDVEMSSGEEEEEEDIFFDSTETLQEMEGSSDEGDYSGSDESDW